MQIEQVPVDQLIFADYNPRAASPKEEADLVASLEQFGFVEPVVVNSAENRKNIIIGGHFRVRMAKKMGIKTVPVCYVEIVEIDREKELNLRLNKNLGHWDMDLLANFEKSLLLDVGFEFPEIDSLVSVLDPRGNDDRVPELPNQPKAKLGDVYQLGKHIVMCGDATNKEDVSRLMNGQKADMVFTDPPYFITGTSTGLAVDFTDDSMIKPFFEELGQILSLIVDPSFGCLYVFCDWRSYPMISRSFAHFFALKNVLCWVKNNAGMGRAWMNKYENILYFELKQVGQKMSNKKGSRSIKAANVLSFDRVNHSVKEHNAQKPLDLITYVIGKTAEGGAINSVVDLFLGSGSTLIACEKTKRICYGMELDPKYIDVIIQRWEDYTGQQAIKL